jgi:antitoxin HicB
MARRSPIGSDFDAFLQEQGLLEESAATALKRVVAWQLAEAMKVQGVTKADMATRMHTSRSQLDRVLGAQGGGMTLETWAGRSTRSDCGSSWKCRTVPPEMQRRAGQQSSVLGTPPLLLHANRKRPRLSENAHDARSRRKKARTCRAFFFVSIA